MQTPAIAPSSARNADVDLVRVVGICAVVAGHVWSSPTARLALYSWHVPLFFVLAGYFWSGRRRFRQEVAKRWVTLGVPYLTWLALNSAVLIAWLLLRGEATRYPFERILLGGSYLGRPYSAFWFVGALFAAVLVVRSLDRAPRRLAWSVAIAVLALGTALPQAFRSVPLGVGTGVACVIFVMVGRLFREYRDRIPVRAAIGFGFALLGGSAVLLTTGLSRPLDLKQMDLGTPAVSAAVAVAIAVGLILLAEMLTPLLAGRVGRWVSELAQVGLMVILSHALIFFALGMGEEGNASDFVIALLLSWTGALLAHRTMASPFVLGVPRRLST